jgi:signal transduction histidine kinase
LAIILNAVYFLKMVQPGADSKIQQYHGMIESEARNAEKIITDLLDFSRIKSVDREPLFITDVVRKVLEKFPAPHGITVEQSHPPVIPLVYADERQMEQVFSNLIVNAYQAMLEGGKLSIHIDLKGQDICISITDTGTGISSENMKKLFEPLFTTKLKGIGLGLAVSKKLVEANNGNIAVESLVDQGTTFTVTLPIKE